MEPSRRIVRRYLHENGTDTFGRWLSALRDGKARGIILVRLNRVAEGNFGDCNPVGAGVHELVIDFGPGYRVYFGEDDDVVVLLGGGNKSSQPSDIRKAKERWSEYNA